MEQQVNVKLAELSRRYNEAEDRYDWCEKRRVYDELIKFGALMQSDGGFYLQTAKS